MTAQAINAGANANNGASRKTGLSAPAGITTSFSMSLRPVSYTHLDVYKRQVEAFVDAGRSAHLLIIAAYRDNEVGATHPVTRLLERFRQRKSLIAEFELGPLHVEHVR